MIIQIFGYVTYVIIRNCKQPFFSLTALSVYTYVCVHTSVCVRVCVRVCFYPCTHINARHNVCYMSVCVVCVAVNDQYLPAVLDNTSLL